jgi:type IX secretion system PorP/SprF family membrane protein
MNRISLLVCLFLSIEVYSQDALFTQFYTSPLSINPALTGQHNGLFRLSGNYRQQYQNLGGGIKHISFAADAKVFSKVGVGLYANRATEGQFENIKIDLAGSYPFAVGANERYQVVVGVMAGLAQSGLNVGNLVFNQVENVPNSSVINPDLSLGAIFQDTWINGRLNPFAGVSLYHIIENKNKFISEASALNILQRKFVGFAGVQFNKSKYLDFVPNVSYSSQGNSEVIQAGVLSHYFFREVDASLIFGLGYRFDEAGLINLGFQVQDVTVGLSYDVNLSSLADLSAVGQDGFELSIIYLKKKRVKLKRDLICPRL